MIRGNRQGLVEHIRAYKSEEITLSLMGQGWSGYRTS